MKRLAGKVAIVTGASRGIGRAAAVNNAAVIQPILPVETADPDDWARNIEINLIGAFHCCRAALPHFLSQGRGIIINLSSEAAHRPLAGWSAYCRGKAALAMLTRSIHLETASRGIRVYGFQPGLVDTHMQSTIRSSGMNEISEVPREKLTDAMLPARVIAWLCTEDTAELAGGELAMSDEVLRRKAGID